MGWIIAFVLVVPYAHAHAARVSPADRRGTRGRRPFVLVIAAPAIVCGGRSSASLVFNTDRGVPLATLICVGIVISVDFLTRRTAFGRHVYAVGGNAEAARRAGISLTRMRI